MPGLAIDQVQVEGSVTDVVVGDGGLLISHVARGLRKLSRLDVRGVLSAGPPVAPSAVAAGLCGDAVFFVDERGLVDARGTVVIARAPLLPVPDAEVLLFVPVCPTPRERMLLVREGVVVVRLDDTGAVVDEVLLAFAHRARGYTGGSARSLKGERPYAAALSLYAPWTFSFDADRDGDLDLVLVHEERALVFRRTKAGVLRGPAVERHLGDLVGAPAGSDIRAHVGGGGLVVTASAGALPEQTVVATIVGAPDRPLSQVARRDVVSGLVVFLAPPTTPLSSTVAATRDCSGALDVSCGPLARSAPPLPPVGEPLLARIDTSLVALSGVVLTGKVPLELRRGSRSLMTLPTVADVRAGRVDGALPVADVDLNGDGRADVVDLGEPGRAALWQGDGAGGFEASSTSLAIPRLDRALGAPGLARVVLVGRAGKKGTAVGLVRSTARRR